VKRAVFLLAAGLSSSAAPALACPSCFGQASGPLIDAARLGIWLLLAVTLAVQGAFAAFFLYLRRRATDEAPTPDDRARMQREWDRSRRCLEP
jgi:hypothetical protein